VQLARVILARRYGAHPRIFSHPPDLPAMMRAAGAALVIGDPALAIDPAALPWHVTDLGTEWVQMTGLPMVFAVWAGRAECVTPELEAAFLSSCRCGREHIAEIAGVEGPPRGFAPELAREYLTHNIVHELGAREYEGLRLFLEYATDGQASNRTQARPR
jgi:predicted solute-binding protein